MDGHSILLIHLIKLIDAHLRCFPVGDAGGVNYGKDKQVHLAVEVIFKIWNDLKASEYLISVYTFLYSRFVKTHLNFMLARLPVIFAHLPVLSRVLSRCQPGPLHHLWSIFRSPLRPSKHQHQPSKVKPPPSLIMAASKVKDRPWSAMIGHSRKPKGPAVRPAALLPFPLVYLKAPMVRF